MKDFFKTLKTGMLFGGLLSLVLGLVLILFPDVVKDTLRYVLGGGLALFGALEVVFVFVRPNGLLSVGRIVPGILSLAVGIVFLFRFDTFFSLIWTLLGLAILVDGVYKLQYAFELKTAGAKNWWINLLVSLAALIFAVVLMIQPFNVEKAMTVLAGAFLLVNGVFDLLSTAMMSANRRLIQSVSTVVIEDVPGTEIHPEKP